MNISDAGYNINKMPDSVPSELKGVSVRGDNVSDAGSSSANSAILNVKSGQMFNGVISDINNGGVKIMLGNNQVLSARMTESVGLNIGDSITFLVRENDGSSVYISPYAKDTAAVKDSAIFKALELNNISPTEKNYNIADTLMNRGMPVDKASMQRIMQQAYKFPDASYDTLISLNKLNIPVNSANISQYEAYMEGTHQLAGELNKFSDSIASFAGEAAADILADSQSTAEDVISFQKELLSVLGEGTEAYEEVSPNGAQIKDSVNTNMLDNIIPAEENGAKVGEKNSIETNPAARDITEFLKNAGLSDDEAKQILGKSGSESEFLMNVYDAAEKLPDMDKQTLLEMLKKGSYKELLKDIIKDKFSLNPDRMEEPEEIDELYRSIYDKTDKLLNMLSDTGGKAGQQMGEQAKGLQERLDFIQNLNNMYTYAQIPVKLSEQTANTELFVYMNKRSVKSDKDEVSAMLHLDMDNLGPTDVHVSMSGSIVHTRFYVSDEESARIIDEHMNMLEKAINDSGYSLVNETITKSGDISKGGNMVVDELTGRELEQSVKRYSFDIRA